VELKAPVGKALLFEGPRGASVRVTEVKPIRNGFGMRTGTGQRVSYEIISSKPVKGGNQRTIEVKAGQSLKRDPMREVIIEKGRMFKVGDPITEGNIDPKDIARLRGSTVSEGFEAERDYVANEIHDLFREMDSGFGRRTTETAVASMASYVTVRDPGDSDRFPMDRIKIGEAIAYNREAKAKGKRLMTYDRSMMGVNAVPLEGENWLSKLNFEKLKSSIQDGAIHGRSAPIHGANPISAYMYGAEFDNGTGGWQY
jgi:hypothetical protein